MCYSPGHVRYEFCLQTYHIWIVTHLCSFVAIFAFILSIDYRQYRHTFYSILKFFFSTSFPKIIFFIFCAFVVYEPAERNFIFLPCRKHQTRKIIFFNWLHFFFSWLFLYHKEVTRVFSSTLNFAWQFIGEAQFYRKLKYANLVERNSILTLFFLARRGLDLFNCTSQSVAFFLTQCEKSTVMFATRPCISSAEL